MNSTEISPVLERQLLLQLGDRIGQMIFHSHADVPKSFSYAERGRYNNDLAATAAKK